MDTIKVKTSLTARFEPWVSTGVLEETKMRRASCSLVKLIFDDCSEIFRDSIAEDFISHNSYFEFNSSDDRKPV